MKRYDINQCVTSSDGGGLTGVGGAAEDPASSETFHICVLLDAAYLENNNHLT